MRRGRGGERKGGKRRGKGREEGDGRTNPKPAATGLQQYSIKMHCYMRETVLNIRDYTVILKFA